MTADDLIRERIDALLQDVRTQHDRVLATLSEGVRHLLSAHGETVTRDAATLTAQAEARVEALQNAATARIAQVEADTAARLASLRVEAAADVQRARDETSARVAALEARLAHVERERDDRITDLEREGVARLAAETRLAELEREGGRLSRTEASSDTAVATEREADLEILDRLSNGVRAIDAGRTLTGTLDALTIEAARQAPRVAILLVRGDRFQGWRAAGFTPPFSAASIDLDAARAGIITHAARTGWRAASSDAGTGAAAAPAFAALPADRVALAVPLSVGGHVVAVLYADDVGEEARRVPSGWPECVEILVRYAARCLEALTASKAVALARGGAVSLTEAHSAESADEAAKRYARLLMLEIKLYHQPAVDAGRNAGDLAVRLAPQIARARHLYEERIGPAVRARNDYFNQALVSTLADGNTMLLGVARSS